MEVESLGVKASLQRAWEIGQWTDVVLVGGDHTEVGGDVQMLRTLITWFYKWDEVKSTLKK